MLKVMSHIVEIFHNNVMFRFLVVGGLNTIFSFGVYSGFILLGLHYTFSSIVAIVIGVFFSYVTSGSMVFRHISKDSMVRYIIMWCVIYILHIAIVTIAIFYGGGAIIGGAIALIFTIPTSFMLQKRYVFESHSD